jgi:hypothetical protein
MRPHTISNTQVPNTDMGSFERFREFARMIVSVPKAEADREMEKSGLKKYTKAKSARPKKKKRL